MQYLLVHGLGISSNIWDVLVPLLDGDVIAKDLPGHGHSQCRRYDWDGLWSDISESVAADEWKKTIVVLHSFSAALLPEIINNGVRPAHVIFLEGILHYQDMYWSNDISLMSEEEYEIWIEGVRSVSYMALKSQLVARPRKAEILRWSRSFREVNGTALRAIAINLRERLLKDELRRSFGKINFTIKYVKGGKSKVIVADFLKEVGVKDCWVIPNAGHFPMIDDPILLSDKLNKLND